MSTLEGVLGYLNLYSKILNVLLSYFALLLQAQTKDPNSDDKNISFSCVSAVVFVTVFSMIALLMSVFRFVSVSILLGRTVIARDIFLHLK